MSDERLSHIGEGGEARMVDVTGKTETLRVALAEGVVLMAPKTRREVETGGGRKGNVLEVARIAGVQGAKRTGDWIPLCHPLAVEHVRVDFEWLEDVDGRARLRIEAEARIRAKTGVEMEALVAVSAAALTVYDMVKAVDKAVVISNVRLLEKRGGKSGDYRA